MTEVGRLHTKAGPEVQIQNAFLCRRAGPDSSYSALVIQHFSKLESEVKMDPPTHAEYFLSNGATTFTFMSVRESLRIYKEFFLCHKKPSKIIAISNMKSIR